MKLEAIRIDGGTQPRASISLALVDDYAESMEGGAEFPSVVVFHDGKDYWLADGFHRYHAAAKAGLAEIACEVKKGTVRDAVLYSVGSNAAHGARRTNVDKREAVLTLLNDEEWGQWSNEEIARQCKVDPKTVGRHREQLSQEMPEIESPTRTVKRGDSTYQQDTRKIGKKPKAPKYNRPDWAEDPEDLSKELREQLPKLDAEDEVSPRVAQVKELFEECGPGERLIIFRYVQARVQGREAE